MPTLLTLPEHTLLAELLETSLDAMFDDQFPENGSFTTRTVANREGIKRDYFYYQGYRSKPAFDQPKRYQLYVGPADDPAIANRVARFRSIKTDRKARASLVNSLTGLGLPKPPLQMGKITEALAKTGVFRMRAVLVGTAAYQTYPALIGMRLRNATTMTGDVDIAQFRSISISIDDKSAPILEILKDVDPTFRAIPHMSDPVASTRFQSAGGFRVDILTPHRGSDDQIGKAIKIRALAGAAADPLRFLDYLIYKPARSIMLYGPGISVNVPAPQRYAIHKLIVATRRLDDPLSQAKSRKDIEQAGELIHAFHQNGQGASLTEAFEEAWARGPRWKEAIQKGAARLPNDSRKILAEICDGKIKPPLEPTPKTKRGREPEI